MNGTQPGSPEEPSSTQTASVRLMTSKHYDLRPRPHNYVLRLKDNRNFIPGHLYKCLLSSLELKPPYASKL